MLFQNLQVVVGDATDKATWGTVRWEHTFILGMELLDNLPHDRYGAGAGWLYVAHSGMPLATDLHLHAECKLQPVYAACGLSLWLCRGLDAAAACAFSLCCRVYRKHSSEPWQQTVIVPEPGAALEDGPWQVWLGLRVRMRGRGGGVHPAQTRHTCTVSTKSPIVSVWPQLGPSSVHIPFTLLSCTCKPPA